MFSPLADFIDGARLYLLLSPCYHYRTTWFNVAPLQILVRRVTDNRKYLLKTFTLARHKADNSENIYMYL